MWIYIVSGSLGQVDRWIQYVIDICRYYYCVPLENTLELIMTFKYDHVRLGVMSHIFVVVHIILIDSPWDRGNLPWAY